MAHSQKHGKTFEDVVKSAFPGAADRGRTSTAAFDIEAQFDKAQHLPTSVKTTQNNMVGLADARRVFETHEPFRLLVGSYDQVGRRKSFHTLHEFCITTEEWARLQGTLPAEEVGALHEGLKTFGVGDHEAGRTWAQSEKRRLTSTYETAFALNPKIDSKSQRRLQASIPLTTLQKEVADYRVHREAYRDSVCLPLHIISGRRGEVD